MEVHDEQWLLLQEPLQTGCQSGAETGCQSCAEDVTIDVMPQPITHGEQSATSNLPIESINKQLELLSQPLSSHQARYNGRSRITISICAFCN